MKDPLTRAFALWALVLSVSPVAAQGEPEAHRDSTPESVSPTRALDTSISSPEPSASSSGAPELDALVAQALARNPTVEAAASRVRGARAAIGPAGARPDPALMLGVRDFPIWSPGFYDNFTMKMLGVGQVFPFPGKLGLRRRAALREAEVAEARWGAAKLEVTRQVKEAYYDLGLTDQLFEIVRRNQRILVSLTAATAASYQVGRAGQEDVLRARVEAARLGEEAVVLVEQRRAVLARLNALLDRPTDTPVARPEVPERLARAAVADSAAGIRFASAALGSRAADSPLPPLAELQNLAVRHSPVLRAHEAMIAVQTARVDLARKEHLPDFDISVQYGQRDGFSDLVTAQVAIPIPVQKGTKYNQLVAEARAELTSVKAEHQALVNDLRATTAALYSDAERDRAQLALYMKAILPQGRGALSSATASFQVGRADFLTLIGAQATLYNYEMQYFRALTDFAKSIAALEETVGREVLP